MDTFRYLQNLTNRGLPRSKGMDHLGADRVGVSRMAEDEHMTIGAADIVGFGETSRTGVNYVAFREGIYQVVEQPFPGPESVGGL